MSTNHLQFVSSFGGESLTLPAIVQDAHLHIHRPTEASNLLSQTTSYTRQDEQLASILDPEVIIPGSIALGIAAGAATAYAILKLKGRKTAAEHKEREAEANKISERNISHDARTLILDSVFANASIETDPDITSMQVSLRGKQKHLDAVKTLQGEDILHITSERSHNQGTIVIKGLFSLIRGGFTLDFIDKHDALNLVAKIPEGSSLTLRRVDGDVSAVGIYGKANIDAAYSRKVNVGDVTEANIKANSSTKVQIASVSGPVAVNAQYNSSVIVDNGEATSLNAKLASSSKLKFGAITGDLKLNAGYNSNAQVKKASGDVSIHLNSSSEVIVDGGNAAAVTIVAGYNSKGLFNGDTREATLRLNSSCYSQIGSVAERLTVKLGYNSRAKVLRGDVAEVDIDANSSSRLDVEGVVCSGTITANYNSKVYAESFEPAVHINANSSSQVRARG